MSLLLGLVALLALSFSAAEKCKTVPCSSLNYKYTSCPVIEAQDITKVTLTIKYSKSACTYGTSYGPGTGSIWVDKGCRGSFEVCYNKKQVCTTLDCSSKDYKFALCDVPGAGTVTTVAVNHKYSKSACDFGHGFGSYADKIWVHHGCRANFKACYTE